MLRCSLHTFRDTYLAFRPTDVQVEEGVCLLEHTDRLRKVKINNRITCLADVNVNADASDVEEDPQDVKSTVLIWPKLHPSLSHIHGPNEDDIIAHLRSVFHDLSHVRVAGRRANFRLVYKPHSVTNFGIDEVSHEMDYFLQRHDGFAETCNCPAAKYVVTLTKDVPDSEGVGPLEGDITFSTDDLGFDDELASSSKSDRNGSGNSIAEGGGAGQGEAEGRVHANFVKFDREDVAVNFVLKRSAQVDNTCEVRNQAVGGAAAVLQRDPSRVHTFSVIIQGKLVSISYYCRAYYVESRSVDFIKHPREFVQIALAFIFSTPQELGYDPHVRRNVDPTTKRACWVYRISDSELGGEHFYKTVGTISEPHGYHLIGSSTRVYEAVEVGGFESTTVLPGAKHVILKDAWLNVNRHTERKIQEEIFGKLDHLASVVQEHGRAGLDPFCLPPGDTEILFGILQRKDWRRFFLTVLVEWRGLVTQDNPPDAVLVDHPFDKASTGATAAAYRQSDLTPPSTSAPACVPHAIQHEAALPKKRLFHARQQYRAVFQEVCKSIDGLKKMEHVSSTMLDCLIGMELMFLAGWVHRDISSGNLLRFEDAGSVRGILADLEYAQYIEPIDGSHTQGSYSDFKTGTPSFMALEVAQERLLNIVFEDVQEPFQRYDDLPKDLDSYQETQDSDDQEAPIVRHVYSHDVESLFWCIFWFFVERIVSCGGHPVKPTNAARAIFLLGNAPARSSALLIPGVVTRILKEYLPARLKSIILRIDRLRKVIANHHKRRISTPPPSRAYYSPLFAEVRVCLEDCRAASADLDITLDPLRCFLGSSNNEGGRRTCNKDARDDKDQDTDSGDADTAAADDTSQDPIEALRRPSQSKGSRTTKRVKMA